MRTNEETSDKISNISSNIEELDMELDAGLDLMDMVDQHGKATGKIILNNFTCSLVKTVLSVYLSVSAVFAKRSFDSVMFGSIGYGVLAIVCVYTLKSYCNTSQNFLDEFKMAKLELIKVVGNLQQTTMIPKRLDYKYEYLLKRLNPDKHINMADVAYLGNNLFLSIANGLLTYVVILMQFKLSNF